jgi:hypothetical protein
MSRSRFTKIEKESASRPPRSTVLATRESTRAAPSKPSAPRGPQVVSVELAPFRSSTTGPRFPGSIGARLREISCPHGRVWLPGADPFPNHRPQAWISHASARAAEVRARPVAVGGPGARRAAAPLHAFVAWLGRTEAFEPPIPDCRRDGGLIVTLDGHVVLSGWGYGEASVTGRVADLRRIVRRSPRVATSPDGARHRRPSYGSRRDTSADGGHSANSKTWRCGSALGTQARPTPRLGGRCALRPAGGHRGRPRHRRSGYGGGAATQRRRA